jgi:hypothetical protein
VVNTTAGASAATEMDSIATIILQYVIPAIAGSSVVGGIVGYKLKERSDRRDNRSALIITWKRELLDTSVYFWTKDEAQEDDFHMVREGGLRTPEDSFSRLVRCPAYASFKPHMSEAAMTELKNFDGWFRREGQTFPTRKTTVLVGATDNPVRRIIAKEIHRIEKAWKLI